MRSARDTSAAAGWEPDPDGATPEYRALLERRWRPRPVGWLRPAPLFEAFNQVVDQVLADVVNPRRQRWVAAQRAAGVTDLTFRTVSEDAGPFSFLLAGDTGEQDESQYAVVAPMLAAGKDSRFMVIVSDVIYPAGDVNEYVDGFYLPYEGYRRPIFALPGNHDWIDGLNGFMFNFCDIEPLPAVSYSTTRVSLPARLGRLLWRASARPRREMLTAYKARMTRPEPCQPGPYWAMDAGPIRLVAIDTGVDGSIDREQAEWLLAVSKDDCPKILLTGKPLLVNFRHRPGRILVDRNEHDPGSGPLEGETVDEVVRDADHRYVAAIGGDVHNYQRYRAADPDDGSELTYVVSGGGGAYLSATHTLAPAEEAYRGPLSIDESRFRCYPLRGDSLLHFTRLVRRHGGALAVCGAVFGLLLLGAATVLWQATATSDPLVPGAGTTGWDLQELAALFVLAAVAAFAGPTLVFREVAHGASNALKLLAVAGALLLATLPSDPAPWVVAGAVFLPLAHAAWWPRRTLFTALLAGAALLVLPWLLRDTAVHRSTGEAVALVTALLAMYLLRRAVTEDRRRLPGIAAAVVLAAATGCLVVFGLAKTLAVVPVAMTVFLVAFLLLSGLAWVPFISAAAWVAKRLKPEWASEPTADQAARWLAEERLGGMTPVREKDARSAPPASRLTRLSFALVCPRYRWARAAQRKFPEIFDANEPPFFRNFLEVAVDPAAETVTISCRGVTGQVAHEKNPPLEDWVTISFDGTIVAEMPTRSQQPAPSPAGTRPDPD